MDLAATLNISPAYFESHQADFVVSTVPIPNPVLPVVVVGPLLTEEDRRHVDEAIRRSGEAMAARKAMVTEKHVDFVSALRILSLYQTTLQNGMTSTNLLILLIRCYHVLVSSMVFGVLRDVNSDQFHL